MEFLSRISVTCFFASYLVTLICEISRLFFRLPVRWAVMFGFSLVGLFAHAVYLLLQTNMDLVNRSPLSGWSAWCLFAAFCIVLVYVWITYRQPNTQTGLFILPLALALIGTAELMRETPGFSETNAKSIWNSIHGGALVFATVVIFVGFVMGLMYVVHSAQLKQKLKKSSRFKLPSLEFLQRSTEQLLPFSAVLMGFGVISGFVLNWINRDGDGRTLGFSNPIVWTSLVLFGWLFAATLVSRLYRPARGGRKMAYLMFSCFFFLVLELALVLSAGHGSETPAGKSVAGKTVVICESRTQSHTASTCFLIRKTNLTGHSLPPSETRVALVSPRPRIGDHSEVGG